ncbi:Stk1 family PASTA domain-containing Ser/Thr kinase [Aeromicrobium phragmitis]|uniref:Stk1 family PASTA domain-containing Ser/Thr kinase n=1 Tax=Aeromicrobium phragmitis TaxID=2478914 RepID=UPI00140DC1E4|nr:Stk1 family PASTA domain-containing Ser/Thr kinase [Aeromicrobium phragmitis]
MTVTGDQALVGHTLDGRYVIHERIARGGMASVFRATDLRLDRIVAVKIMHAGLGDADDFRQRFVSEAKAAAKLNHRSVVAVFDQGTDGDFTYLVMEYVPGRTLRDVLRDEAPMSPQQALAYLDPILQALSEAHAAKLIHRDVKPENVLITPNGEVKVADFGLARAVSTSTTHSGGALIGTVSYLAPEVVLHRGSDPRADVYACGAMLFEMLTGSKPHVADTPIQVAYMHVNVDVAAPSTLVGGLPDYVDALVARATARDPERRSPDARALLHQVRQVRRALADGAQDDPELTADLLPSAPRASEDEPTRAVDLAPFGSAADTAHTTAIAEPTVTWSQPADAATSEEADPPPRKKSRRGALLLLAALVALALTALGGWYLAVGRYVDAPELTGLSRDEAVSTAQADGFDVEFAPAAFSEDVPADHVISTDPAAGEQVLPDTTITVTLSKGQERYEVPDLAGKTVDEARTIVGSLNLTLGDTVEEFHEEIPQGSIIRVTNHEVGAQVKRGTALDIVVSQGREPIAITDYVGKPVDEATNGLQGVGFLVNVQEEFSDDVEQGRVISQQPQGGSAFRGDTITLVVSKGPELVKVPDLGGKSEADAKKALEELGLKLNATRNPLAGDGAKVRFQSPSAGTERRRGETVTVFLS